MSPQEPQPPSPASPPTAPAPVGSSRATAARIDELDRELRALRQNNAELNRRLAERSGELEQASTVKDQFLAVLSHELRTPLAPVLTSVAALEADPMLSPDARATLEVIRRNTELEARLIDDLLDLHSVARHTLLLMPAPVDLHELIAQVLDACHSELHGKRLRLTVQLGADRHRVSGDPARLHQVLWNLLRNAIKFTPTGGHITLRTANGQPVATPASAPSATPVLPSILVEVQDTGIGFAAQDKDRLFKAFEQGERTITRRFGGAGLGLTIARSLAEAHGGTLTGHSDGPGRGATFTLRLPTLLTDAEAVPAPSAEQLASAATAAVVAVSSQAPPSPAAPTGSSRGAQPQLRVLLVEDHTDTARIMTRLLQRQGYRVRLAADLRSALDAARNGQFDVVISDIGLPDGTGLDLIRALRERHQPIRGIAVSGFGMADDIRRSLEAGFDAHVTKPINLQRLQALLAQLTAALPLPPPVEPPPAQPYH